MYGCTKIFKDLIASKDIAIKKRQKLVNLVLSQQSSIAKAARKLMIKVSTAKLIIRRFKQTGTFFEKKMPNYSKKGI